MWVRFVRAVGRSVGGKVGKRVGFPVATSSGPPWDVEQSNSGTLCKLGAVLLQAPCAESRGGEKEIGGGRSVFVLVTGGKAGLWEIARSLNCKASAREGATTFSSLCSCHPCDASAGTRAFIRYGDQRLEITRPTSIIDGWRTSSQQHRQPLQARWYHQFRRRTGRRRVETAAAERKSPRARWE